VRLSQKMTLAEGGATASSRSVGGDKVDPRKKRRNTRIDPKGIPRPVLPAGTAPRADDAVNGVAEPCLPVFSTDSGSCPPPPYFDCQVHDKGSASPKFMRPTVWNVPQNQEMIDELKIGIGVVTQPFASTFLTGDEPVPVIDLQLLPEGPIRCDRCGGYMNPFNKFVDEGRNYVCCLCSKKNTVPREYFCHLDENGLRRDRFERRELLNGSVDFEAPEVYSFRKAKPLAFLFVIDVSYHAVVSGLLEATIQAISNSISVLVELYPMAHIGIMTYDSRLHFYTLYESAREPKMVVIAEVTGDSFIPFPSDRVLVPISNSHCVSLIQSLLSSLPSLFGKTSIDKVALGAAVGAGLQAMVCCFIVHSLILSGKVLWKSYCYPKLFAYNWHWCAC